MNKQSLFHPGELAVQQRADESDIAQRNGSVVKKHIINGALPFIAQQVMTVISSTDESNQIWTSVLLGQQGFICALDDQHIIINPQQMIAQPADPLWRNIEKNAQVGLVIIELSTRRRLRVNGNISLLDNGRYEVSVAQAYPNCPKYIQRRQPALSNDVLAYKTPKPQFGNALTPTQVELISNSDSFFVGSGVEHHHNDASYRGGDPGFVSVINKHELLIPDYQGNSMFNTLGNFQSNPNAGLVFIDFVLNKLFQLTGTAEILWNQKDDTNSTGGTKRYWRFILKGWQETQLPEGINWTFFDYSPHNPKAESSTVLNLQVKDIVKQSEKIKVFRLTAKDGASLPAFEAGAHLPIDVKISAKNTVQRHYSIISSSHDNRFYDIAVRQEKQGRGGSNYLHSQLKIGDVLVAKSPANDFSLTSQGKHHVLIAGGIGITPILAMLKVLSENGESYELHYSVKTSADLAFKDEITRLTKGEAHFYITQGVNGNRLNLPSLLATENKANHVYVCGPLNMIEAIKDTAENNSWQPSHIHYESFGSSVQRKDKAIEVNLKKSGKVIVINPKETILDGLLAAKIAVPFECKRGECGMCATDYTEGTVDHRDVYLTKKEKAHSLCVCVSRATSSAITLNL